MRKLYLILLFLLLVGCVRPDTGGAGGSVSLPTAAFAAATPSLTSTQVAIPTIIPTVGKVWTVRVETTVLHSHLLDSSIETTIAQQPDRFVLTDGEADIVIGVERGRPLITIIHAATVPFGTVMDGVIELGGDGIDFIPFDELTPELKVLTVNGQSPLSRDFDLETYPLVRQVKISGEETAVSQFLSIWDAPASNYDPAKISTVAMSGVLALVRATAFAMEQRGIGYPAEDVATVFQQADIAHVSNEIAFAADCPYPNPIGGTTFCSSDSYFPLLTDLGIDVVEVTGNHVNDWGVEEFLHTLDLYNTAGMTYFGGGRNLDDALTAATFEHNGNKIAFVGCNPIGPSYAWATAFNAGSRPCDDGVYAQIGQLAAAGYQVIATVQYNEFYHYAPTPQQEIDFARFADAGATAVSGSQGHHVQGFAFTDDGAFIHYGLGNLFFDQMDMLGTRQTFVDTYTFYDNRLINVDLWTGLIENYAKPVLMTDAEREAVLTAVFAASGW